MHLNGRGNDSLGQSGGLFGQRMHAVIEQEVTEKTEKQDPFSLLALFPPVMSAFVLFGLLNGLAHRYS